MSTTATRAIHVIDLSPYYPSVPAEEAAPAPAPKAVTAAAPKAELEKVDPDMIWTILSNYKRLGIPFKVAIDLDFKEEV